MCTTHPDIINADLLAFIRGEALETGSETRSAIPLGA
jgi:hypothetical protein